MAQNGSSKVLNGAADSGVSYTPLPQLVRDVYSREILFNAQPNLLMPQFATRKIELGVEAGSRIKITKYGSITRGGVLTEGTHIESKNLSTSQIDIDVLERGNAISTTEFLLRTSFRNTMDDVARLLAIDYAFVTNKLQQDLFYDNPLSNVFGGGATDFGGLASRSLIAATDTFSSRMIFDALEILASNKAIKFGDSYIAICAPRQIRFLLNDPQFVEVARYNDAQKIYNAEVGKLGGIRILESTALRVYKPVDASNMDIYEDNEDTGVNLTTDINENADIYTAIVLGFNAFGFAESLPVELRDGGVVDYGRERNLAWYSIAGEGLIESDRAVIIESA